MSKRPSFQFYPGDWAQNSNLRRCSHELKGIWMDVLCVLHDQDEYGIAYWPLKDIAEAAGTTATKLKVLVERGILKGADKGQICLGFEFVPTGAGRKKKPPVLLIAEQAGPLWFSSRMVVDEYKRLVRADNGQENPDAPIVALKYPIGATPKQTPNAPPDPTPSRAGASSSSSSSPSGKPLSVENAAASNTAEGEKTPSVPLLHPFGLLLQTLEADRGCEFRTTGTAQVFADWSAKGITEAHVREAHATAVQRRQKAGNPSAVNVGLLDVILADLLRPAVSSVVPLTPQDPKERRHRELQAQYAGEVLDGPDGRRFEVMANGLVSVFVGADFQGTLGVDHARAFWDDVDAGVVVPRAA